MPCDSSHMEPTEHEKERLQLAKHVQYVLAKMKEFGWQFTREDMMWRKWADETVNFPHGAPSKVHKATDYLCVLLGNTLSEEDIEDIVYDAHDRRSRELANWWEDHQEADRKKKEQENPPVQHDPWENETVVVSGVTFSVYAILATEYQDNEIEEFDNKKHRAEVATEIIKEMMG